MFKVIQNLHINILNLFFRGCLPTPEQILHPNDLIELKKCIYASQVIRFTFQKKSSFLSLSSVHLYHLYVHIMYVMMQQIRY